MERNPLAAIELFGFLALAGWLVWHQFVAGRRDRGRPDDSPDKDRDA